MSTNSSTFTLEPSDRIGDAPASPGFWRRLFDRLIEAKMAHSEAHVRAYLDGLSDERLADLGFTPDRIKAVRARDGAFNSYWL